MRMNARRSAPLAVAGARRGHRSRVRALRELDAAREVAALDAEPAERVEEAWDEGVVADLLAQGQALAQRLEGRVVAAELAQRERLVPQAAQQRHDEAVLAREPDTLAARGQSFVVPALPAVVQGVEVQNQCLAADVAMGPGDAERPPDVLVGAIEVAADRADVART
jgi:hypothetical protein